MIEEPASPPAPSDPYAVRAIVYAPEGRIYFLNYRDEKVWMTIEQLHRLAQGKESRR